MKHVIYKALFVSIFCTSTYAHNYAYDPLIVAVCMIKDEASVIRQTLDPLREAGITAFLIFDTGSTDTTVEVVNEYFAEHALSQTYVIQEPFIDFATSRNRALDLAEEKFPHAAFLLMPDAEWYLENGSDLIAFCQHEAYNGHQAAYLVRLCMGGTHFYQARLTRCHFGARFIHDGDIHEAIYATAKVPSSVTFKVCRTKESQAKSARRWLHDKDILLARYKKNPRDPRTVFYLAQTCACLGDWESAYTYYKERVKLQGWSEENFIAYCRLGEAAEQLGPDMWPIALDSYLTAYELRPTRAEPLIHIARHYLAQDKMASCDLFAQPACRIPYPKQDLLFVESELYDYERYDVLGRCSWYIGNYDVGEDAVRKALEAHPDFPHLHRNLSFYLDRKDTTLAPAASAA